jgi:predicted aspartyl protease
MAISVSYDNRHGWLSRNTNYSNRPYSLIDVSHSGSGAVSLWGLIDTGADYLCLGDAVAHSLGINLAHCTHYVNITTALGSKSALPVVNIHMAMEGYAADVDAIFDSVFSKTPLIGRCALLEVLKFGVDDKGWLFAQA